MSIFRRWGAFVLGAMLGLSLCGCGDGETISRTGFYLFTVFKLDVSPPRGMSPEKAESIMSRALESMRDLDRKINDLDPISDINAINDYASERPVKVSPVVCELIEKALTAAELTDGVFDPTIEPIVRSFKNGRTAGAGAVQSALKRVDYRSVVVRKDLQTVRLLPPAGKITLDQLKQGFALDQLVAELRRRGISNAVLRAGATVLATGGQRGQVVIVHPLEGGRKIGTLNLRNRAYSSISSATDGWYKNASVWLPVLRSAHGITDNAVPAYVGVVAPNAVTAEALAHALFVLGPVKGVPMLKKLRYDGIVIVPDSAGVLQVHTTDALRRTIRLN